LRNGGAVRSRSGARDGGYCNRRHRGGGQLSRGFRRLENCHGLRRDCRGEFYGSGRRRHGSRRLRARPVGRLERKLGRNRARLQLIHHPSDPCDRDQHQGARDAPEPLVSLRPGHRTHMLGMLDLLRAGYRLAPIEILQHLVDDAQAGRGSISPTGSAAAAAIATSGADAKTRAYPALLRARGVLRGAFRLPHREGEATYEK
jgi:hypothetical protein